MDLDGDGHPDILSGSYWPGDLYVFRGQADGTFAKGEILKDVDGKNINAGGPWKSDKEPNLDSLAASPFAADLRGTGVLDLVVGNIGGKIILIPNEGTAAKPAFNPKNRRVLEADGKPILVPGGDAGPFVVDWDGDGLLDLIVGAGDGSVWLFRNVGTRKEPRFAKGETLVPASSTAWVPVPIGAAPAGPGARVKVCVTDWNGDGRLDLLVGDLWTEQGKPVDLSPEQVKKRDGLKERQQRLQKAYDELSEKLEKAGKDEAQDPEMQKLEKETEEVYKELGPLESHLTLKGSVWLFLRKGKAADGK